MLVEHSSLLEPLKSTLFKKEEHVPYSAYLYLIIKGKGFLPRSSSVFYCPYIPNEFTGSATGTLSLVTVPYLIQLGVLLRCSTLPPPKLQPPPAIPRICPVRRAVRPHAATLRTIPRWFTLGRDCEQDFEEAEQIE
jgi:hypothetical protein